MQGIQRSDKRRALPKILASVIICIVMLTLPLASLNRSSGSSTLSPSEDYQLWVQPYLSQLEKVREVLMTPYTEGNQHYGYDSNTGLIRGGNIEASPAIGVGSGYNDVVVAIDNNLEGSASLDYFNSPESPLNGQPGFSPVNTNIYENVRELLSETWIGVGGCSAPFTQYSYPSSFSLLDMREAEYGSFDPYYSILIQPGNHLGGIGSNCGTLGQTWYLPGYDSLPTSMSKPLIATEFPSNTPIPSTGDLEELSFYIDEMYLECHAGTSPCSLWQDAYVNAMSQYPFSAPREALHFIQVSRATAAWTMSNMSYDGISAFQMLQKTINRIWSSDVGPDGGLYQNFSKTGSSDSPEPNLQAMIAFDPRMPSWFGQPASTTTSSETTSSTQSTTISSSSSGSDSQSQAPENAGPIYDATSTITSTIVTTVTSSLAAPQPVTLSQTITDTQTDTISVTLTSTKISTMPALTVTLVKNDSTITTATLPPIQQVAIFPSSGGTPQRFSVPRSKVSLAEVLGGFASFEVFVLGLIPLTVMTNNRKLDQKRRRTGITKTGYLQDRF